LRHQLAVLQRAAPRPRRRRSDRLFWVLLSRLWSGWAETVSIDYYHSARTHLSLDKDAPEPRPVERRDQGRVVETPLVGGLHHRYSRLAA
jgi:hypothetical protein